MTGLAELHEEQGKSQDAENLLERAIEIQTKAILAANHPDLATTYDALGTLYANTSKFDQANAAFGQALKIRQAALPAAHPHIGVSLLHLAELRLKEGNTKSAQQLAESALSILTASLGKDHEKTRQAQEFLHSLSAKH